MDKSTELVLQLPQAYCLFCSTKTPHVHERLAVNGAQVARSICFTCKRERPKDPAEPQLWLAISETAGSGEFSGAERQPEKLELARLLGYGETLMTLRTVLDEHESRVTVITAIAIEVNALTLSESRREMISTTNPNAEKLVYAKAYQAWVDCRIEGTAEDIFEAVQEVIDV